MNALLNRIFRLEEHGTSVRTEVVAGMTTFVAMAYIIFVNPAMLADCGMPREAAFASTVWAAALTTLLMGFWANMPVALAPGMGINAFFTYTMVLGMGLPWQTALGAVFISGTVFLILTVCGIRELIIRSIPANLKLATAAGIGMFIALIGLRGAGVVADDPATLVTLGSMKSPSTLLSLGGIALTAALMARGVKGSILIGIIATTAAGMCLGVGPAPHSAGELVSLSLPTFADTFLKLDIAAALNYGLLSVLFTMTMVDLFDSIGTLIGLSRKAGLAAPDGTVRGLNKALVTDSVGTILSGLFGTPAVTSYVESASGVAEGGRTGLTAVTTGCLFLLSLFFAPLIGLVQGYATAPALVIVGCLMAQEVSKIDFSDFTEALPAFLTIACMPMTYSIATGCGMGFISWVLLKLFTGRIRQIHPVMWVIAACFCVNFVLR